MAALGIYQRGRAPIRGAASETVLIKSAGIG
jgi:hypothetical protein